MNRVFLPKLVTYIFLKTGLPGEPGFNLVF